jgi:pyruvate-ferredoxin/flavodoxin oxidoreductase
VGGGGPEKSFSGSTVKVQEMQAESGAAGAVHGALNAGALTTTYTASQGLLLMIPNMYKIAGELLPGVFHVTARTVASHTLSIFGDHSGRDGLPPDRLCHAVRKQRAGGHGPFAVAHWPRMRAGCRLSISSTASAPPTSCRRWRSGITQIWPTWWTWTRWPPSAPGRLNSNHPVMRGSHENGDIFFQNREASNSITTPCPGWWRTIWQDKRRLGTDYRLFNYYGAPDAERVIVAMGSVCDAAEEVVDYLTARARRSAW